MHSNGGQAPRTHLKPAPAPRPANRCGVVARFIAGDTVVCGFSKCETCAANRGGAK